MSRRRNSFLQLLEHFRTNSNRTERLKDTPELLKQFYNDIKKGLALTGEKFNSNYNKFEDHSNTIIVSPKINSIVELVNMKTGEVVHRSSMVKGNDVVELDKKNLENGVYAIVIRDKDNNMVAHINDPSGELMFQANRRAIRPKKPNPNIPRGINLPTRSLNAPAV